jgi:hypothetical protein
VRFGLRRTELRKPTGEVVRGGGERKRRAERSAFG